MIIQLISATLHVLWCYIFVSCLELQLIGVAISNTLTALINLIAMTLYVTLFLPELKEGWFLPNKEAFVNLFEYLKVSVPTMLMMCFEWWSFEVQTYFASLISVDSTAAQVIILNSLYVIFCVTMGF